MASKLAAGGPASKQPTSKMSADSRAAACSEADRNPARHADEEVRPSARLAGEVREFCVQRQIEDEVDVTIRLRRFSWTPNLPISHPVAAGPARVFPRF